MKRTSLLSESDSTSLPHCSALMSAQNCSVLPQLVTILLGFIPLSSPMSARHCSMLPWLVTVLLGFVSVSDSLFHRHTLSWLCHTVCSAHRPLCPPAHLSSRCMPIPTLSSQHCGGRQVKGTTCLHQPITILLPEWTVFLLS